MTGTSGLIPTTVTREADLLRASADFGHIVESRPRGVLAARSADAVRELIAFAGPQGLAVSARGGGQALYGEGQADDGYVVDMAALDEVRCVPGERTLVAGAGALWRDVVRAALAEGLAPPVLPDHLGSSVGGVLSTGGFGGSSHRFGLVADWVRELEVVTGTGECVTCSPEVEPELFHAVLAGLGQCALIVRATLRLVPAPTLVRRYRLYHPAPGTFFADQRRLARDARFGHVVGQARPALGGDWQYVIDAVAPHTGQVPTDDGLFVGDLDHEQDTAEIEDLSYEEYLYRLDRDERLLRASGEWQRPHPWLTLLLPEEAAASFVPSVLAEGAQEGLRGCGVVQLRPLTGSALHAPLLRRPPGELLCLLSLMRTAPPERPDVVGQLVAANRAVYERARAVGGVLYPVSALPMTPEDWRAHYGPAWDDLVRAKALYDTNRILTRGYGLWP
ncbi:FAD-binding protein [Streptomyces pseudovenezuelae]|uniref:Cytokinin dehydrogenase n=1 Tax=Streptomyces pseudovenezuelae TaxID=67350 RepID=A0ABT6LCA9_9ACTN|nr:FAD-binding protein [Streptomyces pseudovenezuelae]MDH6213913.1 cytokinin dehydrogenase [Streptomyces pseudovenezuelae]